MKASRLLAVASAVVLLAACSSGARSPRQSAAAHTSSPSPTSGTTRVVIRPVTATGTLARGFRESHENDTVSCAGGHSASPAAVDNDIVACTPESSDAIACWAAPDAGHVLCLRDPWSGEVVELPLGDHVPHVTAPPDPWPLGLTLADGTHCSLRNGGTSSELAGHPTWWAAFICGGGATAVWGPQPSDGIDSSAATWTVQIASLDGTGALVTTPVTDAYFAGTAR